MKVLKQVLIGKPLLSKFGIYPTRHLYFKIEGYLYSKEANQKLYDLVDAINQGEKPQYISDIHTKTYDTTVIVGVVYPGGLITEEDIIDWITSTFDKILKR